MGYRIDTVKSRSKLPARREPYWHKLVTRQYLGFRKLENGEGRWIARWTSPNLKFTYQALGDDGTLSFDEASEEARKHFRMLESGSDTKYTLRQAIDDYCCHLEIDRTPRVAKETRQRLFKHTSESLLSTGIASLKTTQLRRWRDGMVKRNDDPEVVRKSKDTANRVLSMMKAALNLAFKSGIVADDTAWRRLTAYKSVTAPRVLFLTDAQVLRLLEHTSGGIHQLIRAGVLTGARYGELVRAKVSDFNPGEGTLRLSGKTGTRTAYLTDEAVEFFNQMSRDKLPRAYLLLRDDGTPWGTSHQHRPIKAAVRAAKLPRETVFYSLRHYHISKALLAGIPAQVVAENCGTSIRMLEKHYGKFMAADRRAMFNAVALAGITV